MSADFLASDYCYDVEMTRALARHERGEATVIPIILRDCDWSSAPFARIQALPKDGKPVTSWTNRDEAWKSVAVGIRAPAGGAAKERGPQAEGADEHVIVARLPKGNGNAPEALKLRIRTLIDELEGLLVKRKHSAADDVATTQLTHQIDAIVQEIMKEGRVQVGDEVAGTQLIKPIGSGNFATIWLSRRPDTGQLLATKVFHLDKLTEGMMLWRFRRSVRAMMRLNEDKEASRHIVKIHELDQTTLAFSMDYLSEGNLEDVATRGWTLAKKVDVMLAISRAVAHAHRAGVIHRDIKPANVVLDKNREPVLTDFDIADIKFVTRLSTTEGGLGTPVFAAPEQLEDADAADERSDIYSLGRLLYFLLLERSPGLQIERDPSLDNLSKQPPTLVAVVRRATQLDPRRRYRNVVELIGALDRHRTRSAALAALANRAARWIRVNAAVLTIFLLILGSVTTLAVFQRQRADDEKRGRLEAETLQRNLKSALEDIQRFNGTLDKLDAQKSNVREEISRQEAVVEELKMRLKATAGIYRTDHFPDLEAQIDHEVEKLEALRAVQQTIDARIARARRDIANAERRTKIALHSPEDAGTDSSTGTTSLGEVTKAVESDSGAKALDAALDAGATEATADNADGGPLAKLIARALKDTGKRVEFCWYDTADAGEQIVVLTKPPMQCPPGTSPERFWRVRHPDGGFIRITPEDL